MITPLSMLGAVPIEIASPTRKPVVLSTGTTVVPFGAPGAATVLPLPGAPTATTGMTVQ